MLAVNRIAKMKGRIINLNDSIITMNVINKTDGVPEGDRCAIILLKKLITLYMVILIHKLRDNDNLRDKCLGAVKM